MFLQVKLQQDRCGWMHKTAQITYSGGKKQHIQRFGSFKNDMVDVLEAKTTALNDNGAFSAIKNK